MITNVAWTKKEDDDLIEALRGEDEDDKKAALNEFVCRYDPKLKKFLSSKFPSSDSVDDVTQKTWEAFLVMVKDKRKKDKINGNYLFGIAEKKQLDEFRIQKKEKKIENNQPTTNELDYMEYPDYASNPEEEALKELDPTTPEGQYVIYQFLNTLSDCERTATILTELYGYPVKTVARLMGKTEGAISQSKYKAMGKYRDGEKITKYIKSEQAYIDLARWESHLGEKGKPIETPAYSIERTEKPAAPQLTFDEFRMAGLSRNDLQEFVTSILVPIPGSEEPLLETTRNLYLLLTPKCRWTTLTYRYEEHEYMSILKKAMVQEYLLKINIEGDNIILTPESTINFVPNALISEVNKSENISDSKKILFKATLLETFLSPENIKANELLQETIHSSKKRRWKIPVMPEVSSRDIFKLNPKLMNQSFPGEPKQQNDRYLSLNIWLSNLRHPSTLSFEQQIDARMNWFEIHGLSGYFNEKYGVDPFRTDT